MTANDILALAIELEEKRTAAMIKAEADELASLLSNDLYYGHSGGYWDNKADFVSKFRSGVYAYHSIKADVEKAVALGKDAILIHGEVTIEVTLHGVEKNMRSIYLAVWRLEDATWRFAAHQTALKQSS